MKYRFAALRFVEDRNLVDRVYWYLAEFPLKEGEFVLAPVGERNRLQRAQVERTLSATEETAPYDVRLAKHVVAKCGARKLVADGVTCYELGGVKYDEKRYTAFQRVLVSDEIPKRFTELNSYGVVKTVIPAQTGREEALRIVADTAGCVLVAGGGAREIGEALLALARGEDIAFGSLSPAELRALAQKLL